MSKGPKYTKKQLNHAIDVLTYTGFEVYAGDPRELKSTRHIYRVAGYQSAGKSQQEMKDLVMKLANYYEAKSVGKTTRSYHYHDEARERARLQRVENDLKSGYKNPILPTVRKTVQRISKSGTKYNVVEDVQQRELEKEFRSAQRAYNKVSNLYEKNSARYYEMIKEFSKPGSSMTAEQRKEMKDLENWLDENESLEAMGRVRSKRFRQVYEERGAEGARKYLREIRARAEGRSTRETMEDLRSVLELIEGRAWNCDATEYRAAVSEFWDNHLDGMLYRNKEAMIQELKPFASPGDFDPISQRDLDVCTTIVRQYIGAE